MDRGNPGRCTLRPDPRQVTRTMPAQRQAAESSRWHSDHCARWMKEDLKEARELQILLLPNQATCTHGLAIAAGFRPAHEVSGDIYDLFECADGRVVLIFGDACGKGAAAALYGAVVWGLLRALVTVRHQPARLLQALNEALFQRRVDGRSVSLLALLWESRAGRLLLANAGATRPVFCRKGEILEMDFGGVPLGLFENCEYEEASVQMEAQDLVVLCTDGITEQQNAAGEEYGQGIVQVLRNTWQESPQFIVNAIFGDLDQFAGQARLDDQTLVAFRVT